MADSPRAIDLHAHLAREDPAAPPFLRHLFDVEGYLELQAQAGIGLTVLSYALTDPAGEGSDLDGAKAEHEFLHDLATRHAGRLTALATVDPFGGPGWLEEAGRALDAGFVGLCFPTSRNGRYLDAAAAQDAFAFAEARRAMILLHPSDPAISLDAAGDFIVRDWIGRPYDTGICLSRLLLADTLSRYPSVRVVVAHSGGPLPMLIGRLDAVYETLERRAMFAGGGPPGGGGPGGGPPGGGPPGGGPPRGGPPGGGPPPGFGPPGPPVSADAALKPSIGGSRPSGRIGQLYLDTASYHPAAIRAAIETVGIDRVVLGTDFPPAGRSPKPTVELIEGLGLTDDERDRILGENARRLLNGAAQPATPTPPPEGRTAMGTSTTDVGTTVQSYIADLNEAATTRAFPPVIMKWFGPEGRLNFHNETYGRQGAKMVWTHMLPTGERVPREVKQVPYKIENGRVYSWRSLSGGNIPMPVYNLQETQFDDRTLISELHILSAEGPYEGEEDPNAPRTRLGRIFTAFGGAFNDFFATGDPGIFDEWLSDDIKMIVDNNLRGMGIMAQYVRIAEGSKIELGEWEQTGEGEVHAMMLLTDRSGQLTKWKTDFKLTPDGHHWREVNLVPERPMGT